MSFNLWVHLYHFFFYQYIFAKIVQNTYKEVLTRATPYRQQVKRKSPRLRYGLDMDMKEYSFYDYVTTLFQHSFHMKEVIDKTCFLKPDTGPCRAEIKMYYYEPLHKKCLTFSWGGCQGNGNRFDSNKECIGNCLSSPNQPKTRPKWCSLNFDYGFCFGALKRWYYDPMWKVCKERIYSGCGGNKNNFYNREQCDTVCRFGTGVITAVTKGRAGLKKLLIINPWNATPKRGKNQTVVLSTSPTLK